jgi:tetratricopeptide (TPR) repeat protein
MSVRIDRVYEQPVSVYFLLVFLIVSISITTTYAQEEAPDALEVKADTLMSREDYEGAAKLYSKILAKDAGAVNALYKRSICYYSAGKFDAALSDVNDFIARYPSVPQAKLLRTYIYRELGDEDAQLKSLDELIQLEPFNTDLLKWQASLFIEKDQYREAQEKLFSAKAYHDDPEIEMYLGLTCYYLDQPDSALEFFDKSIELDNSYMPSYIYASSLCLEQSAYELALSYVNKGLSVESNNYTLVFYKGIALAESEETVEGCRCLNKAFKAGIDDAAGYLEEYCYKK